MTRLTSLPAAQAKRLAELECPDFQTRPWVSGPPLSQRRVAIVSSAGLVVRGETPFRGRDPDYRAIPAETKPDELLVSHISINFDRTGFQEDWNVVFPLDRLKELAAEGAIGSVARPITRSWAPPTRSRWSRTPANWPSVSRRTRSTPSSSPRFDRSARAP
jgi:D-proline reductase (dithiol) PrdB